MLCVIVGVEGGGGGVCRVIVGAESGGGVCRVVDVAVGI